MHAFDMIGSLKQNRAILQSKRARIALIREQYIGFEHIRAAEFPDQKISAAELAEIKNQIRRTIKIQQTRAIVIAILAVLVFICLVVVAAVVIRKII